jgi:hypothetical protein
VASGQVNGPLYEVPEIGEYALGEVVYNRLGYPVGMVPRGLAAASGLGSPVGLPFLAPLLPAIATAAKAVIPSIAKAVPGLVSNLVPAIAPVPAAAAPATTVAPPPAFVPVAPAGSAPIPQPAPPMFPGRVGPFLLRRFRRRPPHAR